MVLINLDKEMKPLGPIIQKEALNHKKFGLMMIDYLKDNHQRIRLKLLNCRCITWEVSLTMEAMLKRARMGLNQSFLELNKQMKNRMRNLLQGIILLENNKGQDQREDLKNLKTHIIPL